MANLDQKLLQTFEEIARLYEIDTVERLIKSAKRKKLVNTKQLLDSLDSETRSDLARISTSIHFAFEEHGRYLDMKKIFYDSQPPVEKILEWVKSRGLAFFGEDPNRYKNKLKTDERRMNEIAWGIARKRAKQKRFQQNRRWFQSNFYKSLNALQEELLLGVADRSIEEIKESLTYRLKRGGIGKFIV